MKFKEMQAKFQDLDIFIDKDNFGLLEIPQKMKFDFALSMYSEREVLSQIDHDDTKITEILLESDEQYLKRTSAQKN